MSPDQKIAVLASEQHGAFAHRQARDFGFSRSAIRHRLTSGRWEVLHVEVYAIAGTTATWERSVSSGLLSVGRGAVGSFMTAGYLLGLVEDQDDVIHVTLRHGQERVDRDDIVVHQARVLERRDIQRASGLWVTGSHRTLVDLASVLPLPKLEAALDTALNTQAVSLLSLHRYVAQRRLGNNRGMGRLRRLMHDRTKGVPMSELERHFERLRKRFGLPQPARQYPEGKRKIDYAYPAERIAIELDGRKFHGTGPAFQRDRTRQNELVLAGWDPYLFTKRDLTLDASKTAGILEQALSQARVTVVATANL